MKLGELLEFRKDLYFEGAVQADWFYSPERASKVAENFVFHGKQYFGLEGDGTGNKKRIDTISLVEELVSKLSDERSNALSLAVADYGTGKSHLAVTLAQIFSGPEYMRETYDRVLNNIKVIDPDAADRIGALSKNRNFVMVLNGMRDFNLHSEILKAAQRSLKLYGLQDDCLKKLNRAIDTATTFFERNAISTISLFEKAASSRNCDLRGDKLVSYIKENIMTDDRAFDIVNDVYKEINGQEIRWDEGLSASSILQMLVSEYCGMNGMFDHIILLFDEFGRYLEYTTGVNAARSGESGLQQIFELTQNTENVEGYLHVINFIQRDIKAYLETFDQTKNISRYIGRYDQSEKYYILSNLETVFANLIQRKNRRAFDEIVVKWQEYKEEEWKQLFRNMNRWLSPKGMWKDYSLFRRVIIEGIYPLHPLSTYMLTNLSDYLQNRSSLTLISNYIEENSTKEINVDYPLILYPEQLISGDLYTEMLSAEQEGRQKTLQCIKYDNVLRKFGDKLSEKSLIVLRSNLILRILRFRTDDYNDILNALSFCSPLSVDDIREELKWLEDEYAVLEYDETAHVLDFSEESNGAHDYKILKRRLISNASVDKSIISSVKFYELAGILDVLTTNFGINHKISTNEWVFNQELYPIESFTRERAEAYIRDWKASIASTVAKGRLIWLYFNRDTDPSLLEKAQSFVALFRNMPIQVMVLNDSSNTLFDRLIEYDVLDKMDDTIRKKYARHFDDDFTRAENNLRGEIDSLKKKRNHLTPMGVETLNTRISIYLTQVFEETYPQAVPFFFDGFVTKANNISKKAAGYYCSFLKMLLSNSVSEATIHNFVVDMRNRVDALFSVTSNTSWKCISENCKMMPPQKKSAARVYDWIVETINTSGSLQCRDIYERFCMPPYGMSEESVTLMIAVVCANLSYCLRIDHDGMKNISIWKDEVIINDQKVDLKLIKESRFVFVDADAVTGRYMRFFERVKGNTSIQEVGHLIHQLDEMMKVDEVPEELEQTYLLARKTLDSGRKAQNEWKDAIAVVDEKFEAAVESNNLYNALMALQELHNISFSRIFKDNGYEVDAETKESMKNRNNEIIQFINSIMSYYISQMYCDRVEKINTFRNHNTKIETLLRELGFIEQAGAVRERKEAELSNIDEIKSRQELKKDLEKFLQRSKLDRFTSYSNISSLLKEGETFNERVLKYSSALGRDSQKTIEQFRQRLQVLDAEKGRINDSMSKIWDDLYDVENPSDIQVLLHQITNVLHMGIPEVDQADFIDLQDSLQELMNDIQRINEAIESRAIFEEVTQEIRLKYADPSFDFDVQPILDTVIHEGKKTLDQKELAWKNRFLTLGDKKRSTVLKWKDSVQVLPDYLSEEALHQIAILKEEAETIISKGKIDDVIFYFNKLDDSEKQECIKVLEEKL